MSSMTSSPSDSTPTRSHSAASPTYCVVMSRVRPALAQLLELVPELGPQDRIDAGGRLVEEHEGRIVDEGGGEGEAALHPAGRLADPLVAVVRELDPVEELAQAALAAQPERRTSTRGS